MSEKFKITAKIKDSGGTVKEWEFGARENEVPTSVTFKKKHMTNSERTLNGSLVVDYIATKNTVSVTWDVMHDVEFDKLLTMIQSEKEDDGYYELSYLAPGVETENIEDENGVTRTVTRKGAKIATMRVYTEEMSYYPYFLSTGGVVWRDVSLTLEEV